MEKDFDAWNSKKQALHSHANELFYKEREVWWCSLGVNIGLEQDGKGKNFDRPIIILKGFNTRAFLAVGLTSKVKIGKYYFPVGLVGGKEAIAVISQVRFFDTKRLIKKIGTINEERFQALKEMLKYMLFDEHK